MKLNPRLNLEQMVLIRNAIEYQLHQLELLRRELLSLMGSESKHMELHKKLVDQMYQLEVGKTNFIMLWESQYDSSTYGAYGRIL